MPYPISAMPMVFLLSLCTWMGYTAPLWAEKGPEQTTNAAFCKPGEYRADGHGIVGDSFSDPDYRVKKSEKWQKQPIRYGQWAKGADLALTLDQHLYAALTPIVARFAKQQGIEIVLKEGTCGVSQGLLNRKRVDLAGFCCPPAKTDRLPGLTFHTLSISSLAIVASVKNPIENLTQKQVRDIFQGHISDWGQIKGYQSGHLNNHAVWPVGRLHCTIRPGHWRRILADENLFSPRLDEAGSIPEMIQKVGRYPNAVGYEVLWDVIQFGGPKNPVKVLKVDGLHPNDDQALIEGRYPFYRTHSIAIWTPEAGQNPHAKALITYLNDNLSTLPKKFHLISSNRLRKAGWNFRGEELIGTPK
ncbi:substrate-binding domain-containing protein [Magnetococcus sp. PR-3]|uniref:substrate-binding domain-containing protein n=1 Tax=Magnetococcus sp. PR-3 TaxID=3120355 RepID=UPI002FCE321A